MKRVAQTIALVAVLGCVAIPAFAAEYVMKIAHLGPASYDNDDYVPAAYLKNSLETLSNGQIEVQIYPAGQLGNFKEAVEGVQLGTIELTLTSIGGITPFMPELAVVDIPYMFDNDAVAEQFMKGQFLYDMQKAVLEKTGNVRLLSICNTGRWRSMFTTKKLIKSAADLKGVKMRTINSPLQIEFVNYLGGNATPVAWTELYAALGSGVVEGTKNCFSDILANKLNDHVKFATLDNHAYLFGFIWISDSWLKSLPAELQQIVIEQVQQAGDLQTTINKYLEIEAGKVWKEKGGQVYVPTPEEKTTFLPARDEIAKWYVEKYGNEWYDKLTSAVEKAKADVDADNGNLLK